MKGSEIQQLRASFEIGANSNTTNLEVLPAYQVANTDDSPGAVAVIDSSGSPIGYKKATGVYYSAGWLDVSSTTGSKNLIRFGFSVKNADAAVLDAARVMGRVDIQLCT